MRSAVGASVAARRGGADAQPARQPEAMTATAIRTTGKVRVITLAAERRQGFHADAALFVGLGTSGVLAVCLPLSQGVEESTCCRAPCQVVASIAIGLAALVCGGAVVRSHGDDDLEDRRGHCAKGARGACLAS